MKKTTLLLFLIGLYFSTSAQYGGLDPTFGVNGIATFDMAPTTNAAAWGYGSCLQSDGKIIIVGQVYINNTAKHDFAFLRLNADGSLDTSFGNQGRAVYDMLNRDNMLTTVIQLPNGKILGVGNNFQGNLNDIVLVMLNQDGTLDTTYGNNGFYVIGSPSLVENAYGIIALQNGKFLLSAVQYAPAAVQHAFALIRLNADMTLDATFGVNGIKTFPQFENGDRVPINELPDGSIVFSTSNMIVSLGTWVDYVIVKCDANGAIDTTFGNQGNTRIDILGIPSQTDIPYCQFVQDDGKIVVAGMTWVNSQANVFSVCRLNPDGSKDTTFGNGGTNHFNYAIGDNDGANGVIRRINGKYVLGGYTRHSTAYENFGLLFLNADGTRDTSFGVNGLVTTDISGLDMLMNIFELADGKILATGDTGNFGQAGFTAVRYTVEPNLSVDGHSAADVSIYPNPVSSTLSVEAANLSEFDVTVYDVTGRSLMTKSSQNTGRVALSGFDRLPKGTYIVQLESEKTKRSWKILH
ncbi:T9SS type A sorting domain-containing protein [Flavobacterium selenitireducens]|uniref:T9SS type A sorting domain-containing protein n=1 Tax=Flavobacterium selenitireducens TaxID=2722704 RepID=UPI00168B25F4|nr:T9SS type A sorting domain-containing protein [Flavobacterium selenitireducens]MBD3583572.1 T9SS type A sorting domain-containing protein [Flavobacterium selenitireducens]